MRKLVIVCDVCELPDAKTIRVKVGSRTLEKDLCAEHEAVAFQGWRPAKKGRVAKS